MTTFLQKFDVGIEILVAALIYTDRVSLYQSFTEKTQKNLLLTALALASKFFQDRFERSTNFFTMLSQPNSPKYNKRQHMTQMLNAFLEILDFRLVISEADYYRMMSRIKNMIARKYAQQGQIVILESNIRKYIPPNNPVQSSCFLSVPNPDNPHRLQKHQTDINLVQSSSGYMKIEETYYDQRAKQHRKIIISQPIEPKEDHQECCPNVETSSSNEHSPNVTTTTTIHSLKRHQSSSSTSNCIVF